MANRFGDDERIQTATPHVVSTNRFGDTPNRFGDGPTQDPTESDLDPHQRGGYKPLNYINETLSNVPGSASKFISGIADAVAHPIDTAGNLLKTATGAAWKMTPGSPSRVQQAGVNTYGPYADALGEYAKRYAPSRIADTIREDPVGVAADISAVAGGVSGLAKGSAMAAKAARLAGAADAAGAVSRGAQVVSDVTNPLTVPLRATGAALKAGAKPLVKSALSLPGRTERYGATPAAAVLEETSGITPRAVATSAQNRIAQLSKELDSLPATRDPDLTAARQLVRDEIAKVRAGNGDPGELVKMLDQLTTAKPGFGGRVNAATGEVEAAQSPQVFRDMKQQFADQFTKFDQAAPLKSGTLKTGNKAYHELAKDFDAAIPGAEQLNRRMQSLIPAKEWATRSSEHAGPIERAINRATRPTGALAAVLLGLHEGGLVGALAALAGQETLASSTAKLAAARSAYGAGRAISAPVTRRALTGGSVASQSTALPPLSPLE